MRKTAVSLLIILLAAGIVGCGGAAPQPEIPKNVSVESSTSEPSKDTAFESARCTVLEVTDDIVVLQKIDSDIIYRTPISNLIADKKVEPEEE